MQHARPGEINMRDVYKTLIGLCFTVWAFALVWPERSDQAGTPVCRLAKLTVQSTATLRVRLRPRQQAHRPSSTPTLST